MEQNKTLEEIIEIFNAQLKSYGYREIITIAIETKSFSKITFDRNSD